MDSLDLRLLRPDSGKVREPTLGEHFASTSLRNRAQGLIREAIQNSLDARVPGSTLQIRIFSSGSQGALPAGRAARYFSDAWPHFEAKRSGVRNRPDRSDPCPYITYEDFGTTGLEGDPAQYFYIDGVSNDWFSFFRREGDTAKHETSRGRWGVGKVVFPISSRVRSFFALTVRRSDHRRLLAGQAMLNSRDVSRTPYSTDGWFAQRNSDGLEMPFEDQALLDRFSADFSVSRRLEPGLSIVVPYIDVTGSSEEGLSSDQILEAVVSDFFYPILNGDLQVHIGDPRKRVTLDQQSLPEVAASFGDRMTGLLPLVRLAQWVLTSREEPVRLKAPPANGAAKWSEDLLEPDSGRMARERLERGEAVRLRVPVTVRPKAADPKASFFDVVLRRSGDAESGRPVFIREGLIIPDVRTRISRGIRSLVIVEDAGIASFLGDAENPAHTEWQQSSSNFYGKYVYGPGLLRFVTDSVASLVRILTAEDVEDLNVLTDIFSIELEKDDPNKPLTTDDASADEPGLKPPILPPQPPPTPRPLVVRGLKGGFAVAPGQAPPRPGRRVQIRAAYDVRRGNPLKNYHPADFQWADLRLDVQGAEIEFAEDNRLVARLTRPDFCVTVTRFDEARDVYVRADVIEEASDDPAV